MCVFAPQVKYIIFGPKNLELKIGDRVIVETARGVEMGTVAVAPKEVPDDEVVQPLKTVQRIATEEDFKRAEKNKEKKKRLSRSVRKRSKAQTGNETGGRRVHL